MTASNSQERQRATSEPLRLLAGYAGIVNVSFGDLELRGLQTDPAVIQEEQQKRAAAELATRVGSNVVTLSEHRDALEEVITDAPVAPAIPEESDQLAEARRAVKAA